jgi:hypothetical protein
MMKISIASSLVILALGGAIGWNDHQRLTRVRVIHQQVVAQAAAAGIHSDSAQANGGGRLAKPKRERADKVADAKLAAAEFISFAKEMEEIEKAGGQPDAVAQKRILEVIDRLMSLDAGQIKILIAEVRASAEIEDETRRNLIGFSMMSLASDHPQAALNLYTESSNLFEEGGIGRQVVAAALGKLAEEDPQSALAWIRANGEKSPQLVTDEIKRSVVMGAAQNDPKLAFGLIGELEMKSGDQAMSSICSAAKTPESRTATLAALRDYLQTVEAGDERDSLRRQGLSNLAMGAANEGFEKASQWLASAKLSDDELAQTVSGMSYSLKSSETAKWIQWVGESLPPEKANQNIRAMVDRWTQTDYKAAGEWLAAEPAGATKDASVRAYAETISRYEPEAAIEWAMTLPEGAERRQTFNQIYHNWPKDNPESTQAAEVFAEQHGLK